MPEEANQAGAKLKKTPDFLSVEEIAKILYESTRLLSGSLGEEVDEEWDLAAPAEKELSIKAVEYLCDKLSRGDFLTIEDVHNEWLSQKVYEGWTYGAEYDEELKRHPLMVSYAQVPVEQRYKDQLFLALTVALAFEWETPKERKRR